jgi:hypothetical protein
MLGIIGILGLLLHEWNKKPRKFNTGVLHSALTALVAGLVMVGVRHPLNADNATEWPLFNNTKIAVKLGIVLIILVIGYRQNKKSYFSTGTWTTMLGLTVANIIIATTW